MAIKIMLDAGHYGKYNRSTVVPEYWESERMWLLCEYLGEALLKYGFEVSKTRSDLNSDLGVYERGAAAKDYDLFLSLHSNAPGENGGEEIDWVDVYGAYDNLNNSWELASSLAVAIADLMGVSAGYVKTRKSTEGEKEYYGVLRGARAVGCKLFYIVEHSFHTNLKATLWLLSDENLKTLAETEAALIAEYYGVTDLKARGDVNGNGKLDITDIAMIKRAYLGSYKLTEQQKNAADFNGDGKLTIYDYALAKKAYLESIK